jgi:hypothetical protein
MMSTSTIMRYFVTTANRVMATKVAMIALAIVAGLAVGGLILSPSITLVPPLVFLSLQLLVILINPLLGLLVMVVLHALSPYIYINLSLGAGIPDITLARVTIAAITTLLLVQAAVGRRILPRMSRIDWAIVLTAIGIGQSVVRAQDLTHDLQKFFDFYLVPFLVYYIAKNLVVDRRALNQVLLAVFIVGAYCSAYGVYTQLTGHILFAKADSPAQLYYTENLRIMQGLLGSPHAFGLAFNLAIPVTFYLMFKTPTRLRKAFYTGALAMLMVALFLTYKRTAWIAMIGCFLVIQLFYPQFRRLFFVLLLVSGVGLVFNQEEVNNSAVVTERVNYQTDTLNGRTQRWEVAMDLWRQRPIVGHGYDEFANVSGHYEAIESHYLNILVSAGLLGFVPYFWMLIVVLWDSIAQYRRTQASAVVPRELIVVFWGTFAAYLISLYTVIMNVHLNHILFFLPLGAIVGSQAHLIGREQEPVASQAVRTADSDLGTAAHGSWPGLSVGEGRPGPST